MGVPAATFWPGAGDWVTIMLAGLGSDGVDAVIGVADCWSAWGGGGWTITFPTFIPASWRARVALPRGSPVRLGIT